MDTKKLPDVFVSYAADTLAETNSGLTGAQIVKYCNSYAVDFGGRYSHYVIRFWKLRKPCAKQTYSTLSQSVSV